MLSEISVYKYKITKCQYLTFSHTIQQIQDTDAMYHHKEQKHRLLLGRNSQEHHQCFTVDGYKKGCSNTVDGCHGDQQDRGYLVLFLAPEMGIFYIYRSGNMES